MVAAAFINQSFEDSDGVAGVLLAGGTEPYALVDTDQINIAVDRDTPQNVVFEKGSRSTIISANSELYALANGQTLLIDIDGGAPNVITFNEATAAVLTSVNTTPFVLTNAGTLQIQIDGGPTQTIVFVDDDFVDIGAATIVEVLAVLATQLLGATAADSGGAVEITSDVAGQISQVNVVGGTDAGAFAFPAAVSGTGNIQTIGAATAAEVVADLLAQLPGGAFAQVSGTAVLIGSVTKGVGSLIDESGGTAAAAFSFPAGAAGVDHFVDITAATAAEVAARINAQLVGATAADNAGQVELTTVRLGADACVEVLGGTAAPAFAFPTGEECGASEPGVAQGWIVSSLASLFEYAEFSTGLVFPSAYEEFVLAWPVDPGAEEDLTALDLDTFIQELFDGDVIEEEFTWFGDATVLPSITAAGFNSALIPTAFEAFDQGWPTVPGSESDVFVLGAITAAVFDVSVPEPVEDFEEEWKGNEGDGTTLVGLTLWTVGQGGNAETFVPFNAEFAEFQVLVASAGDAYSIDINGIACTYVAQGGDVPNDVADELAACVNNSPANASANANGDVVEVTNLDTTTTPFVIGASCTVPQFIAQVFVLTDPDIVWSGAQANNCL